MYLETREEDVARVEGLFESTGKSGMLFSVGSQVHKAILLCSAPRNQVEIPFLDSLRSLLSLSSEAEPRFPLSSSIFKVYLLRVASLQQSTSYSVLCECVCVHFSVDLMDFFPPASASSTQGWHPSFLFLLSLSLPDATLPHFFLLLIP